jgi:hypothetical protein
MRVKEVKIKRPPVIVNGCVIPVILPQHNQSKHLKKRVFVTTRAQVFDHLKRMNQPLSCRGLWTLITSFQREKYLTESGKLSIYEDACEEFGINDEFKIIELIGATNNDGNAREEEASEEETEQD